MKEVFRRTGLGFAAKNLHKHWTTPKGLGPSRPGEIKAWIALRRQPAQPVLVLDDRESGWNLVGSSLNYSGYVVLCEPGVGFVAARLVEAQTQLRAQTNSKITSGG